MTRIKLLFTSDEHGRFRQAAQMQSLVDKERASNPNTFLVSSGDVFQGTPESDLLGGVPSLNVLDKADYSAVQIGNHDFDNGLDFLKAWTKSAKYPVLGANIIDETTGARLEGVTPYTIFERAGAKVALIGVVTPETPVSTRAENVEGIRFEDPSVAVRKLIPELKEQGVDVVGVLSHLGAQADEKLASEVEGLGFILGGHTHLAYHEPKTVNGTLICQPGAFREFLGKLEFSVDPRTDTIAEVEHELIPLSLGQVDPQSDLARAVQADYGKVESATSAGVTINPHGKLSHRPLMDGALDHLLADSMTEFSGADVAMFNRKMIRADIEHGVVTAGDLYSALPFPDKLVTVEVTRDKLISVLERSRQYSDHRSLVFNRVGFDGIDSVDGVFYWDGTEYRENPEKLTVVTTDFLAKGGLGYDFGVEGRRESGWSTRSALEVKLDGDSGEPASHLGDSDLVFDDLKESSVSALQARNDQSKL